jgi:hypothetical protein
MENHQAFLIWLSEEDAELLLEVINQSEQLEHDLSSRGDTPLNKKIMLYIKAVKILAEKIDFEIYIPEQYHEKEMTMFKINTLIKCRDEYLKYCGTNTDLKINELIEWYKLQLKE